MGRAGIDHRFRCYRPAASARPAPAQAALNKLSDSRTSITIAHRLGTIAGCDQIIVLDAGAIVERGTHSQLLALGGEYEKAWKTQLRDAGASEEMKEAQ